MGSMRAALRAGTPVANKAARLRTMVTAAKVMGSVGWTPNNILLINLEKQYCSGDTHRDAC